MTNVLNERMAQVKLAAKDLKARGTCYMWGRVSNVCKTTEWMSYENVKKDRQLNDVHQMLKQLVGRLDCYENVDRMVQANISQFYEGVLQSESCKHTVLLHEQQVYNASGADRTIQHTASVREVKPTVTVECVLKTLEYDQSLVMNDMRALLRLSLPTAFPQIDVNRVRAIQRNPRMRAWLAVDEDSMMLLNGGSNALDPSTSYFAAQVSSFWGLLYPPLMRLESA